LQLWHENRLSEFNRAEPTGASRVEPHIGIRVRLYSKGSGRWSPSAGENAKFGLDTTNLVAAKQALGLVAQYDEAALRPSVENLRQLWTYELLPPEG